MMIVTFHTKCPNCSPGYIPWAAGVTRTSKSLKNSALTSRNRADCPNCYYHAIEEVRLHMNRLDNALSSRDPEITVRDCLAQADKEYNDRVISQIESRKSISESRQCIPGTNHSRFQTVGIRGFECTACNHLVAIDPDNPKTCPNCGEEVEITKEEIITI